jgi:hypothetical protein
MYVHIYELQQKVYLNYLAQEEDAKIWTPLHIVL